MVLGRAYQPPQRRPMDHACYHLETIKIVLQEKTTRETSQAVERRPGQILERHDLAEESTIQANLETACWGLRPTTGHNGCPMMMMMTIRRLLRWPLPAFSRPLRISRRGTWNKPVGVADVMLVTYYASYANPLSVGHDNKSFKIKN